jgi:hypothetical protein
MIGVGTNLLFRARFAKTEKALAMRVATRRTKDGLLPPWLNESCADFLPGKGILSI